MIDSTGSATSHPREGSHPETPETGFAELLKHGAVFHAKARKRFSRPAPADRVRGLPCATPAHFAVSGPAQAADFPACLALPYCFDFDTQELVCTIHDDLDPLLAQPFLHEAQRQQVQGIVRVPWASLGALFGPVDPDVQPSLVFSIGRCGSTLLHALARVFTPRAYSEPDTITQLALHPPGFDNLEAKTKRNLTWYALAPFVAANPPDPVVVKFRSHANRIVSDVVDVFPRARYFFMVRRADDWARSMYRSFGKPPQVVARQLGLGIRAATALSRSESGCEIIHYEELLASPLRVMSRILRSDSSIDDPERGAAAAQLMGRDSQSGTSIARDKLTKREDEDLWMKSFQSEWADSKPRKLLERLQLDL